MSRNFYRERFNIAYPQVDQRGAQPDGYVETGLELHAFIVSAASFAIGFHHESGRILSALCFIASALLTWTFVRRRYGDQAGLIATFLYAFGFPLMLFMERAFMNEAMLVALSLAALVAAQRCVERPSTPALIVLFTATSLVAAIKLPYLIVWAPIAGLFIERYGIAAIRRPELWLTAAINVAAAAAWYTHAHRLAAMTGLSVGLTDKLFDPAIVFSFEYFRRLADRFFGDIMGPVGIAGTIAGSWAAVRERRWCELLGLAGFGAYLVVVAGGNFVHNYYQLAIMPIAPALITLGLMRLAARLGAGAPLRRDRLIVAVLALAAASTFIRSVSANSWYEYSHDDVEACARIGDAAGPDARVVFIAETNPKWLFCTDTKGWLLPPAETNQDAVRRIWQDGATVSVMPLLVEDAGVREALKQAGERVASTQTVEVFRMR